VVAYLFLAPPLFLLAPLLLLLLFSRPTSLREWVWIVLSAGGGYRLTMDLVAGGVANRLVVSSAAFLAGAFVLICHLIPHKSTLTRAVLATAIAAIALGAFAATSGITVAALEAEVETSTAEMISATLAGAPGDQLSAAVALAGPLARLFPGMLALHALAGLALAWSWYHLVATRPLGNAPAPFRQFRFNDHLIWGAIFTLGLALVPLGNTVARVVQNGLVVWTGLYAARGWAVTMTALGGWPLFGRLVLTVLAVLAFPIAVGTLITLGLADTWLNFRARARIPPVGG